MAEYLLGRIKFVYQGAWQSNYTYVVDDVVTVGGKTYICVINNTSSSLFATDLNAVPSYWSLVADGQQWKSNWATSTYYNKGDLVKYYGIVYQANTAHNSAASTGAVTLTTTGASGTGTVATITFSTQGSAPYSVGQTITVAGVNTTGPYNGTFTVTACTTSSVSYTSSATGSQTVAGTVTTVGGLEAEIAYWDQFALGTNYRSAWATNTYYHLGDIVTYGGYAYYCATAHVSASTASLGLEQNQSAWQTFNAGISYLGTWAASTRYKLNDVVKSGANLYICTSPHTSSSSIDSTGVYFQIFLNGFEFLNSWTNSTAYNVGDIVTYGGYSYVATQINTNQQPSNAPSYWTPVTTGFSFQGDWVNNTYYKVGSVVRLHGYTYLSIIDSPTLTQTITATSSTGNLITVASTTGFVTGMSVTVASNVGNLVAGTTYYVLSGFTGTQFSVSLTPGGSAFALSNTSAQSVSATIAAQPGNATYWSKLNSGLQWTNNPQTYTGLSGTNVSGTGNGATFTVVRTGTVYTVTNTAPGSGYAASNQIKILGTSIGGLSPVNDLLITVSTVSTGAIATFTYSGISVTWTSGTNYVLGDVAFFGANSYICVQAHSAASGNRPDADTTGTYWNLLAAGAEVATLTTAGDTFYYGPNGPTRLPIGTNGQVLRSTNGYPAWQNYGLINNLVYVGPAGVDGPAPTYGLTVDTPWKTIQYACQQIEAGYQNPQAQYLLQINKQFMMKEVTNFIVYTYQATVTNISATTITAASTANLVVGMPIVFTGSTFGGVNASTTYYVVSIGGSTTFSVSTTYNGSATSFSGGSGSMVAQLSYNSAKCERDTGIIVDAVIYDLGHGGTAKTTAAALSYFSGVSTFITTTLSYQVKQSAGGYAYLSTLIGNVLANTAPTNNYQSLNGISVGSRAIQNTTTGYTAETGSTTISQNLVGIITTGLLAGTTTAIPVALNPNTTISVKTGTYNEVLPINLPTYTAIVGDELRSTVIQPYAADPVLTSVTNKNASALNRIKSLLPSLISNTTITPTSGNTATQVTTLPAGDVGSYSALTLTATATTSGSPGYVTTASTAALTVGTPVVFASSFGGITGGTTYYVNTVINTTTFSITSATPVTNQSSAVSLTNTTSQNVSFTYGTSAVSSVVNNASTLISLLNAGTGTLNSYVLPWPVNYNTSSLTNTAYASTGNATGNTANYGDGVKQILQNYTFIKADVAQYFQNNYSSVWTGLGSSGQTNFQTQIGFILDAVVYDMIYGGNTQSIIAGSAYYSYYNLTISSASKAAYLASLTFLQSEIANIVTKTAITAQSGNAQSQVTTGTAGSAGAGTFATACVAVINTWINTGAAPSTVTPYTGSSTAILQTSFTNLQAARSQIQLDGSAWVQKYYQSLNFVVATCQRDIGYIVDALSYDLVFGSNFATQIVNRRYYAYLFGFTNTSAQTVISSQLTAELGMINFLAYKAKTIAASGAVAQASSLVDDINNFMSNGGSISGYTTQVAGQTTYNNTLTTINGAEIIRANIPFLKAESTAWLTANFGGTVSSLASSGNVVNTSAAHNLTVGDSVQFTASPITITATATTVSTDGTRPNQITVNSTTGLVTGAPIVFSGTTFGNIVAGTTYYVSTIPDSTHITVSNTGGGSAFQLITASGTMTGTATSIVGNLVSGTTYYVMTVPSSTSFTVSTSPTFAVTATATAVTTNYVTVYSTTNLAVGQTVVFTGSLGGITSGTTYYITNIITQSTNGSGVITLSTSAGGSSITLSAATGSITGTATNGTVFTITTVASPAMTVVYTFSVAFAQSDIGYFLNGIIYDLQYTGNYRSLRYAQVLYNSINGSQTSNMFLVRNASGLRNCTLNGLIGTLTAANSYGTKRPTAGAFVSLDPGFGPWDSNAWVNTRSHYSQNVTMFGTACTGAKIDASLHAGGNKSMVKNDFTTILSDGIGVWCTGSGSLTELVSVFNYYGYSGYLAELGGRIRATNGNSSYGTYGVIAEGVDTYETPLYANLNNRANQAYITNTVTDAANAIYRVEYANAGTAYSNAAYVINGSGFNATAIGDEYRDAAVYETRLIDLNNGNGYGGAGYITAANTSQGSNSNNYSIVIAAADTGLSNTYTGMRVLLTAGSGVGQYGYIYNYNSGTKSALIGKESFTTLTITATTQGTPSTVTVASTATLYVNMPFYVASTVGGLTVNTVYFVQAIASATTFNVATSSGGAALTTAITTTTAQSVSLYAAGWDHVVPGTAIASSLNLTTTYIIEPRISYTAPGYAATSRTLPASATWKAATFASNNYVAVASGSTNTAYSVDGKSWTTAGALPSSQTWTDVVYGGGQGAAATVTVGGLGGGSASLTAVLGTGTSAGQVVSVTINAGGYGYTTTPTIVFSGGGGSGATATCAVLNGAITSVTVTIPGSNYSSAPTVTANTSVVTAITMTTWGRNYSSNPTVTIADPFTGSAWTSSGTATLNNYYYYVTTGVKNWYQATVGGTFTTTGPSFTSGSQSNGTATLTYVGTTAIGTPTLTNTGVSSIAISTAGYGYTTTPLITITDTNAKFVAISGASTNAAYQTVTGLGLGSSWTASATSLPASNFASIAFGVITATPLWVAVGGASSGTTSTDGSTWGSTAPGTLGSGSWVGIAFGAGVFVALASTGVTSVYNGSTWTAGGTIAGSYTTFVSITYGNGRFVAMGSAGQIAYSLDYGTTWTVAPSASGASTSILSSSNTWTKITYGQGLFLAIAQGTVWATSPEGINWTVRTAPGSSTNWAGATFGNINGNPLFVAVSNSSGTVAASAHTGATAQARTKVVSNALSEIRMIEPGSGYAKGAITTSYAPVTMVVNSSSGNNITVSASISGVVANQPITFASNVGSLTAGTIYYVVSASGTTLTVSTSVGGSATSVGTTSALTVNATTQSIVIVDQVENAYVSQPVEFQNATAAGLTANTIYYIVPGSLSATTNSFAVSTTSSATAGTALTAATSIGGTYTTGPIITITDPNQTITAPTRVRTGTGVLGNPSFSNRGTNNATATTTVAGDGYSDIYQASNFVNVTGLYSAPTAGANVTFATITGTTSYYKLVQVNNLVGSLGNYSATFQINPALSVYLAPAHGTQITTRLKYSQVRLTGHDFLYIGTGNQTTTNYPNVNIASAIQSNQTLSSYGGRVFFTSTDQDGNFNVGNLFAVQQATGTATLNASAFNLSGLQSLQLGSVSVGTGSAVITQFSTDPYFTANSDNILPTQRAIRSYITSQIGGGQSSLNVNSLTSGSINVSGNTITSTIQGTGIIVKAKMNFTGGIDGAPVALQFFFQR